MSFLFVSEGVPSTVRLVDTFLVFVFLRFRAGSTSPMLPTAEGGGFDLVYAQRFIDGIQWFITDMFDNAQGSESFMYHTIYLLRHHLESPTLAHAWASFNRRTFSVVILKLVRSLWLVLPQWDETV